MNIYIFTILLLLGLQASHALLVFPPSRCASDLAELKINARNFITAFKEKHDQSHDTVAQIALLCVMLFDIEHHYLDGNYSTDLIDARCQLKSFVDGYAAPAAQLLSYFDTVLADCDELLTIAGDFVNNNNLNCKRFVLGGCEAELNALRCELSDFLKDIKAKRDNAVNLLNGMKSVLAGLNRSVDRFASTNDLTCGGDNGNEIDYCKLKSKANQFFVEFNENHWFGHVQFIGLQFVCDQVTNRVSTLNVKYSCF